MTTLEVRILTYELPTDVYTQSLSILLLPGPCRSECCHFVQIEGNMLHSVSSRHLGKGEQNGACNKWGGGGGGGCVMWACEAQL